MELWALLVKTGFISFAEQQLRRRVLPLRAHGMCRGGLWTQVCSIPCCISLRLQSLAQKTWRQCRKRWSLHLFGHRTSSSALWRGLEEENGREETEGMLTQFWGGTRSWQHSGLSKGSGELQLHTQYGLGGLGFLTTGDYLCSRTQLGAKEWRYIFVLVEGGRYKKKSKRKAQDKLITIQKGTLAPSEKQSNKNPLSRLNTPQELLERVRRGCIC